MADGDQTTFTMTDLSEALASADGDAVRVRTSGQLQALTSKIDAALTVGVGPEDFERLNKIKMAADAAILFLGPTTASSHQS